MGTACSALLDVIHSPSTPTWKSAASTPAAPISGVEEVDAVILSYLPVDTLQALALDQQRPPARANRLLVDDSRLWASLLARTLGVDIVHGSGIPYRTLFIGTTMIIDRVRAYEGDRSYEGWPILLRYIVKSVVTTSSPLGRETLGLLVAVLDHVIVKYMARIKGPSAPDVASLAFAETMIAMGRMGCVAGWEAVVSRYLELPLPDDFPMTQYKYYDPSIIGLIDLSEVRIKWVLLSLCELMVHPHVTTQELERLTTTYLWHSIADRVGKHLSEGDGYALVMEALQRGAREGCNPSRYLPVVSRSDGPVHPTYILSTPVWQCLVGAASSPDKMRFFLTHLVPLSPMDRITTNHEAMMETLLLSSSRPIDDYSVLSTMWDELNVSRLLDGHSVFEPPATGLRAPPLTAAMEPTLIKTFLTRIRTREQADRFMTYVAQNSMAADDDPASYDRKVREAPQIRGVELLSGLVVDRHHFPYPYLMAAYDAFYGRLEHATLDILTLETRVVDRKIVIPFSRDDMVIYIAEALIRGRTIREPLESDPNYATLCTLLRFILSFTLPVGAITRYHSGRSPGNGTMHGTVYGLIVAAMYDEALFVNMAKQLAPKKADDYARLDLLMSACAVQYAEAQYSVGNAVPSSPTVTNPQEGRLEVIVHERCMQMIEEYYHKITPTLERWDNLKRARAEELARSRPTRTRGNYGEYLYYPGLPLWERVCRSTDPLVSSVILSMAECRRSSRRDLCDMASDARYMYWMDYRMALDLPRPQDYAHLVTIGARLPSVAEIAASNSGDVSKYNGPTRDRYMEWLRGLLPLLWEADKYDALATALRSVEGDRSWVW